VGRIPDGWHSRPLLTSPVERPAPGVSCPERRGP
jgi:hypothetical protein